MSRKSDDSNPTRRKVLKAVGAAGAVGVGSALASPAAASTDGPSLAEIEQKQADYMDPTRVSWSVAQHAEPTVAALAEEGFLDVDSAADLPTDTVVTAGEFGDVTEGAMVSAHDSDGLSGLIVVETRTESHRIDVVVQPEADKSYASVEALDGSERVTVRPDRDATTQGPCYYDEKCRRDDCGGTKISTKWEYECCEQGGTTECDPLYSTGECCQH